MDRVILGIDPGTSVMGYGVINVKGKKVILLGSGVLYLKKYADGMIRLRKIFERTLALIDEYLPDELAIEAPFFGKNVQSMLKLGRAQGICMAAGLYRDIPIFEYAPKKVKQSVTGNGSASKQQVAGMLKNTFELKADLKYDDETDGIAVALCHHYQQNRTGGANNHKESTWGSFIKNNPDRLR